MPENWTGKTIVVAVSDSQGSETAFRYAINKVMKEGDHLRIVHVQKPEGSLTSITKLGKVPEKAKTLMERYWNLCKELGVKNHIEDIVPEEDSAGATLCKYLQMLPQEKPDDVVLLVGSKEYKGMLGRAFQGSVSEYCVQNAHCPVTVVKAVKPREGSKGIMDYPQDIPVRKQEEGARQEKHEEEPAEKEAEKRAPSVEEGAASAEGAKQGQEIPPGEGMIREEQVPTPVHGEEGKPVLQEVFEEQPAEGYS